MSSKTIIAVGVLATALMGGMAQAQAPGSTLTIGIDGTAGPILQGNDPLGLNGKSASVTVLVSEQLKPKKHSKTSATYKIPAGAITLTFDGTSYQTNSPSKMTVTLGKTADTLTLVSAVTEEGITVDFTDTTSLAPGSWTNAVLQNPAPFTPSPQTLSSPSSKLKYSGAQFGTTVVGISGTASSSDAPDPELPDDGE
ncbi:MAG: hypothetical protein ABSD74_14030 [Rhizomicrobium sp.]|jgi:hypothetical protein